MKHFERVGIIDVEPILDQLKIHEKYFAENTARQDTPGSPHSDTETIFLRMPPTIDVNSVFTSTEVFNYPLMSVKAFSDAVDSVAYQVYGSPARAMIVRLKPGGHIPAHIDEGRYAEATERYHLCITSNDKCYMQIEDEIVCAKPGELWFFDKTSCHEVRNDGDTPRIHLIVDVWRIDYIA